MLQRTLRQERFRPQAGRGITALLLPTKDQMQRSHGLQMAYLHAFPKSYEPVALPAKHVLVGVRQLVLQDGSMDGYYESRQH